MALPIKKISIIPIGVLVLLALSFFFLVLPRLTIVTGYTAKNMCSCVFVGGLDEERVIQEDLNFGPMGLATIEVDYEKKSVEASIFGFKKKTAVFREGLGCGLVNRMPPQAAYTFPGDWQININDTLENWFAYIDTIDYLTPEQLKLLRAAVDDAFQEPDTSAPSKNTRAVIVLHRGQLVAQQYAPGIEQETKLLGWSLTKSLTSSMVGMLVEEGKFELDSFVGVEQWENDERKKITWRSMIQMNSGLQWDENYAKLSDAVSMLFDSDDIGGFAQNSIAESAPMTAWEYSSGTSNIIARNLSKYFASHEDYIRYPYDKLFYKIGMYSMVIEADAEGYFVGSSYSWATPRDWAKIGQLYLQNGNWDGVQIIPASWVQFVQQPAPNSNDRFGGHFWLNRNLWMPDVPADTYSMNGFQGQRLFIIPSEELVVLRLGLTYYDDFDFNDWLKTILDAIDAAGH